MIGVVWLVFHIGNRGLHKRFWDAAHKPDPLEKESNFWW